MGNFIILEGTDYMNTEQQRTQYNLHILWYKRR